MLNKKIIIMLSIVFVGVYSVTFARCCPGPCCDKSAHHNLANQNSWPVAEKQALLLRLIDDSTHFRRNRWRLIEIAKYQEQLDKKHHSLTMIQLARKERYVTDRDKYNDRLASDLAEAQLFFPIKKIASAIANYTKWAQKDKLHTADKTFPDSEYKAKLDNIIQLIYTANYAQKI